MNAGHGVPNNLEVDIISIPSQALPSTDDAVQMYHSQGELSTAYLVRSLKEHSRSDLETSDAFLVHTLFL